MLQDTELKRFIEAYRDALARGPRALAELYAEPCVTVHQGVVRVHATREEAERCFAETDTGYRARGFSHGDIRTVSIEPFGANGAVAIVRWAYLGACEELLWKATCAYTLHRHDGAWRIVAEMLHDA